MTPVTLGISINQPHPCRLGEPSFLNYHSQKALTATDMKSDNVEVFPQKKKKRKKKGVSYSSCRGDELAKNKFWPHSCESHQLAHWVRLFMQIPQFMTL
jgi:hypothetical protein